MYFTYVEYVNCIYYILNVHVIFHRYLQNNHSKHLTIYDFILFETLVQHLKIYLNFIWGQFCAIVVNRY